jgi:hypothetical protein
VEAIERATQLVVVSKRVRHSVPSDVLVTMVAHRHHVFVPTSLGHLLLVAEPDALVGLYFPRHR